MIYDLCSEHKGSLSTSIGQCYRNLFSYLISLFISSSNYKFFFLTSLICRRVCSAMRFLLNYFKVSICGARFLHELVEQTVVGMPNHRS